MRTSLAALLSISVLFVGVTAISEAAQQAKPNTSTGAANASYNLSVGVFNGVGQAGTGIVWFGVAAVVLVALGLLVASNPNGGR